MDPLKEIRQPSRRDSLATETRSQGLNHHWLDIFVLEQAANNEAMKSPFTKGGFRGISPLQKSRSGFDKVSGLNPSLVFILTTAVEI